MLGPLPVAGVAAVLSMAAPPLTSVVAADHRLHPVDVSALQAPVPAIEWGSCDGDYDPVHECGTVEVPLDYDDPSGRSLEIAVIRYPADPAQREGSVLFNPGGPGGSGFEFIAIAGSRIADRLGLDGRFDVVGFDPRGVERSGGIRCLTDEEFDEIYYSQITIRSAAANYAEGWFESRCRSIYGDTLRHYSTANTARDMDVIREALGDEQISYIGVSYGTYLGGVYATLFPNRVRAMVLDSAFDPDDDSVADQWMTQLVGFEGAFESWAAWCEQDATCAFHAPDVAARWDALIDRLSRQPLRAADDRLVTEWGMLSATIMTMYDDLTWPALAGALADAEAGEPEPLLAMVDRWNGRSSDGTYSTQTEAGMVIRCASGIGRDTPDDAAEMLEELRAAAQRFSRGYNRFSFDDGCAELVGTDIEVVTPDYDGKAPVIVVGGLNDPATPFRWTEELAERMGSQAAIVSYGGEGHGYLLESTCVAYLQGDVIRDLSLPAPFSSCNPDPVLPRPAYWEQLPVPAGVGDLIESESSEYLLGLRPSQMYAEVRTLTAEPDTVAAAYTSGLIAGGHKIALDPWAYSGVTRVETTAPDGTEVTVIVISPAALAPGGAYERAARLVPLGEGLVVVLSRAVPPPR